MNDQNTKLPTSFWIISIVGLVWNIMGVISFFMQTFMGEEALAKMTEEQRALYEATPSWITVLFAIGVFGGTLGCVGLLLKKAWSVPLFLFSLVAVIIQFSYNLFMTDAVMVYGVLPIAMSLIVIVIAIFLYYYSKRFRDKGWIG